MISKETFTVEWLQNVNEKLGWKREDNQLKNLEKAIAALYLLECMVKSGLLFVFKGGTSLLLVMQKVYRLSVDIDVVVDSKENEATYLPYFEALVKNNELFSRFEKDERDNESFSNTYHFKFFYKPFADEGEESYILLDLYCGPNPYEELLEVEISSEVLCAAGESIRVKVPSVNCLLADKLTAFAPETIGIPLSAEPGKRPKRVEAIKQMYDVGNLFIHCRDVPIITATYKIIAAHQIEQRKFQGLTYIDTLRDTAHYAYLIGLGGSVEKEKYESLSKGFNDFRKFVVDLKFDESDAVLSAAKIAYIIALIKNDCKEEPEFYQNEIDMTEWKIVQKEYKLFNEYKFSNPEAFFYWFKAIEEENAKK
ncbi:MAG: hypothetical protein A2Y21_07955 [Clostridiales bacterium GWC2_40_7]|nr:MAG: hypothetical protein A2Y21_07955 [Clostridiales bacterium GWC2_40_7]